MRFRLGGVVLVALLAALIVTSAFADEPRFQVAASVGSSFSNVGTTWAATGAVMYRVNDRVGLVGELGALPRAPFDEAREIAMPLPALFPANEQRVDGYHVNANLHVRPWVGGRVAPYLTAGVGAFVADSVGIGRIDGSRVLERRREADWATNVGGGATLWVTDWLGVSGDYRSFFLYRDQDTPKVHRVTAGINLRLN